MATKRVDTKNPVVREILRQGKGKDPRLVAAALETGRIESNFTNLPGGDADSVNWRQERASIYGGDMSIRRSVARFYKEAEGLDRGQPSYELAADVQRPAAQYRGRYKTAQGEALSLLGGGGSQSAPQSSAPAYQSVTTTTPGVDNSRQRKLAVASFLGQGGVKNASAVTQLAGTYGQLADVPGTTSTQRVRAPSAANSNPQVKGSGKGGSEVLELIHNDGGKGYGIKNGQTVNGPQVFSDVWAGHANHVHVAAGPKTVVALGRLAQSMGLHVSENPHFGGVNPGAHVQGSYHVKGEAIDVSGDPRKMDAYSRAVEKYNRTRKLPK